jgi:hypothetical protein
MDDGKELLERYPDFEIRVVQEERGIKLEVKNAPAHAFVDGKMIKGINEHLFAVLRDIIYVSDEINDNPKFDMETSSGISNAVFHILRNAKSCGRWLTRIWWCAGGTQSAVKNMITAR